MRILLNHIKQILISCLLSSLIFLFAFNKLSAAQINWVEVDKTNNGIQFIDSNSIKYNNRGILSVKTKFSEMNPSDQTIINTDSYLMAVDCENRLFSKLPLNADLSQVKNWENPNNDKLIKKTIINSCSY